MTGVGKQRGEALVLANAVRNGRAAVKREVRAGQRPIEELLEAPPPCCEKVPVFEALQWLPRVGQSRARRISRALVSETLTIGCLGPTTRRKLLERIQRGTGV